MRALKATAPSDGLDILVEQTRPTIRVNEKTMVAKYDYCEQLA